MSCFYRGTGGCSQLYSPYCGALENDCQFCGPRSMGASCANWNGQALFGNSCCAKRLRLATESTLLKRKSFSKRIAEEEAKDALKNKKNKKGRKNSQDLEIMFKALENYCDPKKCENCRNGCGKCGKEDGTKADQKKSATNIKSCSSKTSRVLPSELANTKKPDENQEEANKEKTKPETKKQLGSTPDTREKSSALANAAKPGKYENPITTKPSENKVASRANENKEASKVTPQSKRQLENSEASKTSKQLKPEATKDDMERRQFNELEICNILTDLLVKKFKAIDYNNKKLSTKKYTPSTSLCCSKCSCEVCSCLGSTDFSEVESKIGTAIGSLLSENQSKGKNVAQKNSAQKENDTKKLKTPKETLPIGMSPMAAINPRRTKERTDQKIFVDASTSMSDSNDDVKTMMVKKVPNSSPIDKLINELNEIEEEEAKCCKTSSKGYWSEIDDDLSDPVLKKKKKVKGAKKLSTKGARKGSLASKRSSTESKVDKKRKSSSNCVCKASDKGSPAELTRGSRLKEGCNINTCMSKECSARKLSKPMIEILTYASNLNVERSSKSSRAGSPDRDTKESTAQDLSKRKCSRASQTLSLIESVQEGFDARSSSRGSTSTSQIEEHESHNARLPSTKIRSPDIIPIGKSPEKKPSISAPDIRASVSSAEKRQSKTSDKRQSVTSPDSRKLTTSPDSRKATTSPDSRKPNTSPDNRKPNTSPDSRKPVTSPDSRKPTTSPDSRQPDRKLNTSPDSRKPATSPDSRKPTTSPDSRTPTTTADGRKPTTFTDRKPTTSPVNMNCCNMNSCTSKECPPKNRSLRAESSRMESLQKCCDSRSSSRGSTSTSQIEEHESHSVRPPSTKTRSPNIIPSVKSSDKKTSTSAPDIKASGSSATKRQSKPVDKMKSATSPDSRKPTTSPDSRKPTTSPDSRKPTTSPDSRKPITSPDSRQPITSLDIRPSTPSDKKQSPDNKPSIRFPDKNQTISSDKTQFITSPDEMLSNGRQEEGCKNSCSRKEGPAKNFNKSPQEESPTTVPKESTPKDLPARKCTIALQTEPTNELFEKDRNAIPRKKETAPIKVSSSSEAKSSDNIPSVRTPDKKLTRRSPTKKSSIRSAKTSSVRSPDKKPSARSSDKKPSIRSSAKKQSSPRQREGCCMQTCTSKECRIKKSSQIESFAKETTPKNLTRGKSARSPPTVSQNESLQKDRNSRRTPTASSSVTPVKTNASPGHNMRSTDNNAAVRSSDKKIAISTSGKTTTVRASNKKLAKSSPVNKRSNTSPENSYSSSSPHILSSSSRPDEDLIIRTNSSAKNDFAKKYSCECRTSTQSKTYAEESNESTEDDASNENPTIECSIQKRTVYSQTVVLNESSLEDTDSSNVPGESKIANDSRIPAENTRGDNFSRNNSCQCDTDETDESSIKPFDMSQQMDVKPSAKSALKANFNEKSPTAGSRQSKTKMMCKSLSEKDVSLREEEMRMADFSANESCACDLQKEEDPMKSPVFDRCLCDSYPTNFHPCRTEGNRCPCNDERKSGSIYLAGDSKNTTRRSSDKGQTENKSEAYSSRKKSPNPDERTPTENGAKTYSGQNNCGCQCIYKAPNLMEISPHGSKPNLFAFINTKTDDSNMSDANAKNLEVKKQSATPDDCTFPAKRDERRAECNQALAAFRKLQECFSDFDLEGECFKKLENYAEFHSDIFGPSCLCDQNLNSNSDDKKRNSKALSPDEKENERPESKNKQNKSKERTK